MAGLVGARGQRQGVVVGPMARSAGQPPAEPPAATRPWWSNLGHQAASGPKCASAISGKQARWYTTGNCVSRKVNYLTRTLNRTKTPICRAPSLYLPELKK